MFHRILVGTDGSEAAARALGLAADLAQRSGAELTLLHVPHPETVAFALGAVAGYHAVTTMPPESEIAEAADKVIAEATEKLTAAGRTPDRAEWRRGDPGVAMIEMAKEIDADLIVTGRRGLGSLSGLILGSTSQYIAHHATCAVLTVP